MLFWKRWVYSEINYPIQCVNQKKICCTLSSFSSPSWIYCSPGVHPYSSLHNPFPKPAAHSQPSSSYQLTFLTGPFLSIICITRCNDVSRLTLSTAQSNTRLQRGGIGLVVREDQLRYPFQVNLISSRTAGCQQGHTIRNLKQYIGLHCTLCTDYPHRHTPLLAWDCLRVSLLMLHEMVQTELKLSFPPN